MPGHQRPLCSATAKSTGKPCKRRAAPGGTVCEVHGGAAPQVASKADQRAALAQAERIAARVGVILDPEDPYEGAAAAMRQARQLAYRLGAAVDAIGDEDLRYEHEKGGEQVRAELTAYQRAIADQGQLAIALIRAGLDERLVDLAQARAEIITAVLLAVLDALGLDEAQRETALAAADAELERQAVMLGA